MTTAAEAAGPRLLVRVWFGEHPIATFCAEPALAKRYADAMRRRFAGLKITDDPIRSAGEQPAQVAGRD